MSLTRVVPAAVPSLRHSSRPCTPSSATKNRVPFTTSRIMGSEPLAVMLLLMSVRRVVPAAVPSLRHNSRPLRSKADKNNVPSTSVRLSGEEHSELTRTVPAAVPSLRHNPRPCVPSSAEKNNVPLTFVRELGEELELRPLLLTKG